MTRRVTRRPDSKGLYKPESIWRPAAGNVLWYSWVTISSPLLLHDYITKTARRIRNRNSESAVESRRRTKSEIPFHQQRNTDKPQELPVVRPRALTSPLPLKPPEKASWSLSSTSEVPQQTIDQSNSFILAKLPIEIRTRIWELVIAGRTIEVFRGHGRLLHRLQEEDVDDPVSALSIPNLYADPSKYYLLSLLKTCRQVYTEVIEILYSRNTFSLWQNDTLFDLRSTTLACRFSAIRSLTLHWQFRTRDTFDRNAAGLLKSTVEAPWNAAMWREACQVLKGMPSLKELFIVVRGPFLWSSGLLDMLLLLSEVRVEKEAFLVHVPWPEQFLGSRDEELKERFKGQQFPFRIVHPAEQVPDGDSGPELIAY